eukprot:TRINITY_DN3532_c0_g1_i5.p1 TRINITY_DN3532_c0_g1~~TRINITY_DN3532_c0_g1_i5.p1  ORF type:complete len:162 (+),score=30.47 TRINITY_DN3532_c0_g1_i5:712-1197(+)
MAPETILGIGYDRSTELWSVGILTYELLAGCTPFKGHTTVETYNNVLRGMYQLPDFLDHPSRDLIRNLLLFEKSQRLGFEDLGELKIHRFFSGVDWNQARKRKLSPPFVPDLVGPHDTHYFDSLKNVPPEYDMFPSQVGNLRGYVVMATNSGDFEILPDLS